MCTVTIFRSPVRLLVTMNRDERRTRDEEGAPRVVGDRTGARWIGPTDGESGGTWFGVNDRGMVSCLLNAYATEDIALLGRDDVPSRGEIIPQLMQHEPRQALQWFTTEFDPSPYPSFTLLLATLDAAELYSWRLGGGVSRSPLDAGWSMATSSWWRTDDVIAWRRDQFERWRLDGAAEIEGIPAFNLLEVEDRREWSPWMTRSFSMTRSLTQAEIRGDSPELTLRYWRRDLELALDPARPTATADLPLTTTAG